MTTSPAISHTAGPRRPEEELRSMRNRSSVALSELMRRGDGAASWTDRISAPARKQCGRNVDPCGTPRGRKTTDFPTQLTGRQPGAPKQAMHLYEDSNECSVSDALPPVPAE